MLYWRNGKLKKKEMNGEQRLMKREIKKSKWKSLKTIKQKKQKTKKKDLCQLFC